MIVKIITIFLLISQAFQIQNLKSSDKTIDEVMTFIESQLLYEIKPRQIKVFTGINWDYDLLPSVSKFLFEDIKIIDNFASKGQVNRPGKKYEKHYICVHDTGDHLFGAYQWSEVVRTAKIGKRDYLASFQYVVGNDGYFHNIPDDEVAYHAGDGHSEESLFGLRASGVIIEQKKIQKNKTKIEINKEGYFTINGKSSKIRAPTNSTNNGKILTTKDINDLGIYYELKEIGKYKYEYYLGRTWYNPIYEKISNYGGNFNSIGIESCVNINTDVYYTWQKVAKLVAKLMQENSLTIDAVVQHHYFSGKNCPQTIRTAKLWDYFKSLVLIEYQMLQYKNQGYSFKLIPENFRYVNRKGRILEKVEIPTTINYSIIVKNKNGKSLTKKFSSLLFP